MLAECREHAVFCLRLVSRRTRLPTPGPGQSKSARTESIRFEPARIGPGWVEPAQIGDLDRTGPNSVIIHVGYLLFMKKWRIFLPFIGLTL